MQTILSNIPAYVYAIFVALLAMGIGQSRPRTVALRRTVVLPLAMTGLSAYGVIGAFGPAAVLLLAWAGGVAAAVLPMARRLPPAEVIYDAASRSFALPGSWAPLALMMAIFMLKFAVGMSLGLQPSLHQSAGFAFAASAAYGLCSGVFLGRALPLWKLAMGRAAGVPAAA